MTWGQHGRADGHRYMEPVNPKSRRMCRCGCKKRATHLGMSNGVSLAIGCELSIRRWVKFGLNQPQYRPKPANEG